MSMEINTVYNNYTGSYTKTNEKQKGAKITEKGSVEHKTDGAKKSSEEYLKELQNQTPYIKLQVGNRLNQRKDTQVNVVDVSPKLLKKMQNDPIAAKQYSQRLKDVEAASKWADSYHKMKGNTVVCRHGYVDEDGNFSNFAVIKKNDEQNEKLRKEAEENAKKRIEETREKMRKKSEEAEERKSQNTVEEMLAEKLDNMNEDESVFLDNEEMQLIIQKTRE